MSEPILPIPTGKVVEPLPCNNSGEGAQTALAAMIRQRRMGENHVEEQSDAGDSAPKESPAANE